MIRNNLKIAVLYNKPLDTNIREQQVADEDTVKSAMQITQALQNLGHKPEMSEIIPDRIADISRMKPDLFFNLCEWTGKDFGYSLEVLKIIEKTGIAYSGCGYRSFKESSDKILMKKTFQQQKILSPAYVVFGGKTDKQFERSLGELSYPVILKPAYEHCSIGVYQDSVVGSYQECLEKAQWFYDFFKQPILIEEYIEGREIHVTVIRGKNINILPPAEILFLDKPGERKLFTFESKWEVTGSARSVFDKSVVIESDSRLYGDIGKVARDTINKIIPYGYVRLDYRLRKGKLFLLEINVNPSVIMDPEYTMIVSIEKLGWDFERLVKEILNAASYPLRMQKLSYEQ